MAQNAFDQVTIGSPQPPDKKTAATSKLRIKSRCSTSGISLAFGTIRQNSRKRDGAACCLVRRRQRFKWTSKKIIDIDCCHVPTSLTHHPTSTQTFILMASTETEIAVVPQQQQVVKKQKKLKPARKQVLPGQVEKKEAPQTGKEYSAFITSYWVSGIVHLRAI